MRKIMLLLFLLAVVLPFVQPLEADARQRIDCSDKLSMDYQRYYFIDCVVNGGGNGSGGGSGGTPQNVYAQTYYVPWKDEYRMDYTKVDAAYYKLWFEGSSSNIFEATYNFAPTGTHYLTCNGTYMMKFYDSSGNVLAETEETVTTLIPNPSCSSYADGVSGKNDQGLDAVPNGEESHHLTWNPDPNAAKYEIWKDGQKVGETTDPEADVEGYGSVSVIGRDENGNITSQSDITLPTEPGPLEPEGCNVCEKMTEMLACPAWDEMMGDLTGAIKNALPTLPEWRQIAEQFVDAFADYFGDVPPVPTKPEISNEIVPQLPPIDTTVPDASGLTPQVPSDFNQPMDFDITTGPEIPVVDESQPFTIYEPDAFIDSDEPGDFVYPGDPRNSSNGIKRPDTIHTEYEQPTPTNVVPGEEGPQVPPAEIPIPGQINGGVTPEPSGSDGIIPIPTK